MKALLIVSFALLLMPGSSSSSILWPGKYNGVVIFDRWGGCHLYAGVYQMEISEKAKESLRPYSGKAILIDAQEVWQPMNPGDALITKLKVLGEAEIAAPPRNNPALALEGLGLRSMASFSQPGYDELIVELRNDGPNRRGIDTDALGVTLLTKKRGFLCLNPADGPSYPILTRWSVSFMHQGPSQLSCQVDNEPGRAFLAPGFALSRKFELDHGQSIEIPIRFELAPGEYEFLAGYGNSYQARTLATNLVDFDVDDSGKAHLTNGSLSLNQVRPPRRVGPACGGVTLDNGNAAVRASVYLWSLPFPKEEPRAANMATTDENGFFQMEAVTEGKYILSAMLQDLNGVYLGAFGGMRPLDGVPLSLPNSSMGCPLLFAIHPQPTYSVRGRTQGGSGRTVRMALIGGDAFPFESSALVQPDGRYEFRHIPAGRYQFTAGWTGGGVNVNADIEDVDIDVKWPDRTSTVTVGPPMPADFNQEMTVVGLKIMAQAERSYAKTYNKGFARNLDVLGPPPKWYRATADHAGLLNKVGTPFLTDEDANHFTDSGYRFTYVAGEPDANGKITRYSVSARPSQFGKTGRRNFFMDESGAIHVRNDNRPATKADPLVRASR